MGYTKPANDFLVSVLENDKEDPIVRHEAAEGLGNMYHDGNFKILEKYCKHSNEIIRQSCILAFQKLKNKELCKERCGLRFSKTQ